MNPQRKMLTKRTLLETLAHSPGYAVPEPTLKSHVLAMVRPALQEGEWEMLVDELLKGGLIVSVENALDEGMRQFATTERGRVVLATI